MTKTLLNLVGKKLNADIEETEIQEMAKQAGYTRCQLRESGYMYDCQYDTGRLQVHLDENKVIADIREG
jgi:hypothetical protein